MLNQKVFPLIKNSVISYKRKGKVGYVVQNSYNSVIEIYGIDLLNCEKINQTQTQIENFCQFDVFGNDIYFLYFKPES